MNQYPAQALDTQDENATSQPQSFSPVPKLLPILIVFFIVLILGGGLVFFARKSSPVGIPTPTPRPTATPFLVPTIPSTAPTIATVSATISPTKIGRLAFIKDGNIYHSDLATFSLLAKNATPAGDKLSWSPEGNLLAWRPKSQTATPSALTIYNREKSSYITVNPVKDTPAEIVDYAWSSDEKKVAILFRDNSYKIALFSTTTGEILTTIVNQISKVKQILWPKENTIIFSSSEGISIIDVVTSLVTPLISINNIVNMELAPDKNKLLYSVGDNKKGDLYIVNIDGSNNQLIASKPAKIDMGTTGLSPTILDNGFIPYVVWFPEGDKLLVGYHYLTDFPLVGIYNLQDGSFQAITLFTLYKDDTMIDDYRLLGARINQMTGVPPTWQLSLFTIEDNTKLGIIRTIPGASSPAFFGQSLD